MGLILPKHNISRRQLLQWSSLVGGSFLLNGCNSSWGVSQVNQWTEPLNQTIDAQTRPL